MKPAYPDGTATLPMPDSSLKPPPRPAKPASGTVNEVTLKARIERKVNVFVLAKVSVVLMCPELVLQCAGYRFLCPV